MRRRRRNKKLLYALQISWIVLAITATIVLITQSGKWFGNGDNNDSTVVNAEGANGDKNQGDNGATEGTDTNGSSGNVHTGTITPEPTITPTTPPVEENGNTGSEATPSITPSVTPGESGNPEDTKPEGNDGSSASTGDTDRVIDPEKPMVALTFDDGPYPPVTKRILETLEKYDGRATFFVMGNRMDLYSETAKSVFDAGNQIGNHTFSHKDLTKLDKKGIKYEVEHSNECINKVAEVGDAFLRPPYGAKSENVSQNVKVPMIAWSVDTLDWKSRDKNAVFEEVKKTVKDGDIILMHDLYPSTADAVELIVPWLVKEGYQIVTVQEMFEAKGMKLEAGKIYHNAR